VALILAAGKGTRMKADLAKVLFPIDGRPLIHFVVDAVEEAGFARTIAIVGHQHEDVRRTLAGRRVEFALQAEQLGTGHAVQCAAPLLAGFAGDVAVLAGDAPLIRGATLRRMMERHAETGATVTVLTAVLDDPSGYGRVLRDGPQGRVIAIVEDKDCTPQERRVAEINSSIYAFSYPFLAGALGRIDNRNRQGEYYLTDTVSLAFAEGRAVEGIVVEDPAEVSGINTKEQLDAARAVMRERAHE
jgi:bifunctional UDP-N-acetylglucosamine pyrophosphorylase/glucosamine-1-phosphate N-acetyltransferase